MSKKQIRVLFVGNSYTYYNDMPDLFREKAEKLEYDASVASVTKGGYYLKAFADPQDEYGQILRQTVEGQEYDVVVLQDQSCNPIQDREGFLTAIGALKSLLEKQTTHFVLYATWGRKEGCPKLEELELTNETMTQALAEGYQEAADRYGMKIAHVGRAFSAFRKVFPDVDLYNEDLSHPSVEGSNLAAETILKTVIGLI